MRLQDLLPQRARVSLPGEARRDVLLGDDLHGVWVDGGGGGGGLHAEERLDRVHLGVVAGVSQRLALGSKPASGQPLGILVLLEKVFS